MVAKARGPISDESSFYNSMYNFYLSMSTIMIGYNTRDEPSYIISRSTMIVKEITMINYSIK